MKNLIFLLGIASYATLPLTGQTSLDRYQIPEVIYGTAFRIEIMKSDKDCSVISYVPMEYNETLTPRDDRDFGVQYLVSGKDCEKVFDETLKEMKGWEKESYAPVSSKTLMLDSLSHVTITTSDEFIADGCTKAFFTSFWGVQDEMLQQPKDPYLGMDVFVESADPSSITGPFDVSSIKLQHEEMSRWVNYLQSYDYYKLREMQVNRKLIVEKLRAEGKLKDITPVVKQEKLKVKRVKQEN